MTERFDAAIVGGGPAGAIIARRLALRGWRTILIERGGPFRNKTCGHCLAPRALPLLEREGLLDLIRSISTSETNVLRVHAGRGRILESRFGNGASDKGAGLIVPRDHLDQALRDAAANAGAVVLESTSARVTDMDDHGATLSLTKVGGAARADVRCRLLIGADGVGSSIARAAGLVPMTGMGRKYGFATSISGEFDEVVLQPGAIEMFLMPHGYVGFVRNPDQTFHVAGLVGCKEPHASRNPTDVLAELASIHPSLSGLRRSVCTLGGLGSFVATGPMPWLPRDVATQSVALVGDAAGYIEPFTGEGMAWAIESAMLLGDAIERSDGAWNAVALMRYRRSWRTCIARKQRLCRAVAAALEWPMLCNWMMRAAIAAPMVTRKIVARAVAA